MTTREEEIEEYIAILVANLSKTFNPTRVPGQRSTARAEDRARFVKRERRKLFKTDNPLAKPRHTSSFEGRTRFNPESPNAFVQILNENPDLIANAARELERNSSGLYAICSRVTHPEVVKQMFLNRKLIEQIAREGKKTALMQKFERLVSLTFR